MKIDLTITEIVFIQYVAECVAYGAPIDVTEGGKDIAKRISQITSNAALSADNQVKVDPIK